MLYVSQITSFNGERSTYVFKTLKKLNSKNFKRRHHFCMLKDRRVTRIFLGNTIKGKRLEFSKLPRSSESDFL